MVHPAAARVGSSVIIKTDAIAAKDRRTTPKDDVVLAVDDARVATLESFYKRLWARDAPDAPVRLTVLQGPDVKTVVIKPQDRMLTLKRPSGI